MLQKTFLIAILAFVSFQLSHALSPADDYYLRSLLQGGPASIRGTAQAIYKSGAADTQVTDTLAEIIFQHYPKQDRQYTDALAWAIKALGNTHNPRYRNTLQEIIDKSPEKKLRKYANASIELLSNDTGDAYVKGSINLQNERDKLAQAPSATTQTSASSSNKITAVMPGMSQEQAYALAGFPTSTTTHITGKQFIPYNFKGGDTQRIYALYKGQGTLVFTKESRYTSTWQVLEVIINTNESGYP